jgi:hypothetical protein
MIENEIIDKIKSIENNCIYQLFLLHKPFIDLYSKEEIGKPYNINILDEIHANENTHSRILLKMLNFQQNNRYIILESFLEYLGYPFCSLEFRNPILSSEKSRIDLRIRDNNFSIIIENKINGADDQEQQLERYIKNEKEKNYQEEEIYILYLTDSGGSPNGKSISIDKIWSLGNRYKEISYYINILPWLKHNVAEIINNYENAERIKNFRCAYNQYVDYLEGRFNCREGEIKMNNSLISFVEEKLDLANPNIRFDKKIEVINDMKKYIEEMKSTLYLLEDKSIFETLDAISDSLKLYKLNGIGNTSSEGKLGEEVSEVLFYPEKWKDGFCISLCFEFRLQNLFIAIENKNDKRYLKTDKMISVFEKALGKNDEPNDHYLYCKYIAKDKDEIIDLISSRDFLQIIERKIEIILGNEIVFNELKNK